ncbi:hypothetical protein BJX61DRAFT_547410 [Aspergillus egyptiacus]|nr:hypothetical protein BJX61DRAFT_547410 [Aspergillus egyptiacus]
MAESEHPVRRDLDLPAAFPDPHYLPYWARAEVQYAKDLLDYSPEPIEYDYDDKDYWDNHFFFPEDCSCPPPKGWELPEDSNSEEDTSVGECYDHYDDDDDIMIPGLPDIKMLDAEALSDLLEDNLSPPEITSIFVFATNGAIFAYASSLPSRQLRNLSATYGAAYTCYAKSASSGNLTGVNPASHPSSYVTAHSISLGDVGSIVFELDDLVAIVTKIADKVLLAVVGPSKIAAVPEKLPSPPPTAKPETPTEAPTQSSTSPADPASASATNAASQTPTNGTPANANNGFMTEAQLETQYEIERTRDLERLASLNLSTTPAILLALESKSAALGRFLAQKLEDLESPEDF